MNWSWRWVPLAVAAIALVSTTAGQTAANNIGDTRAEDSSVAITPNDLAPDECASITVTAKLSGSGTINGTAAAELITGGPARDTIDGTGGNDCIVGGAGDDSIRGSGGTDICIGGPGNDAMHPSCETVIQ